MSDETVQVVQKDDLLWVRDIDASLSTISQFIIHGAIRDRILSYDGNGVYDGAISVDEAIWRVLERNGFDILLKYDALDGLQLYASREKAELADIVKRLFSDINDGKKGDEKTYEWFENMSCIVEAISIGPFIGEQKKLRVALLIDFVTQVNDVSTVTHHIEKLMMASLKHVGKAVPFLDRNYRATAVKIPIFWIVDKPNDLPGWMLTGDGIRQVSIPLPDLDARMSAARTLLQSDLPSGEEADNEEYYKYFASVTEGMSIRGLIEIRKMAQIKGSNRSDILANIASAARQYRVGLTENPWQKEELRKRIIDEFNENSGTSILRRRVKGQEKAVKCALDILSRSSINLTAAHSKESGTGPRGVLFFAGATGVGKTEMAKAISELVFGHENALVRFDMSEFSNNAAETRLIGAPPGYVGHGAGGELTNAVRRKPFSVLLFDEIEKSAPLILDKFLQILSDGRLTDGSGDTVYFSETIIIFTSNLGASAVRDMPVETEEDLEKYEEAIHSIVKEHFQRPVDEGGINRPELLGRIGDNNIIVFRPIAYDVAKELVNNFVNNVLWRVLVQTGKEVILSETAQNTVLRLATGDLSMGGRGITKQIETTLVNPLARYLFTHPDELSVKVEDIVIDAFGEYVINVSES